MTVQRNAAAAFGLNNIYCYSWDPEAFSSKLVVFRRMNVLFKMWRHLLWLHRYSDFPPKRLNKLYVWLRTHLSGVSWWGNIHIYHITQILHISVANCTPVCECQAGCLKAQCLGLVGWLLNAGNYFDILQSVNGRKISGLWLSSGVVTPLELG